MKTGLVWVIYFTFIQYIAYKEQNMDTALGCYCSAIRIQDIATANTN